MSSGEIAGFADGIYESIHPPVSSLNTFSSSSSSNSQSVSKHSNVVITFKETTELFASKYNIPFVPSGKSHKISGKDVFLFGKIPIYFDGHVIYAQKGLRESKLDDWTPIGLDELVQINSK